MQEIKLDIVRCQADLDQAFALRRSEFIEKQHVPEEKEFDGNDFSATHIIAKDGNKVIGTMRVRYFHDFVRFERMCVSPDYRKQDIPNQILAFTTRFLQKKGFDKALAFCKKELLGHWLANGHLKADKIKPVKVGNLEMIGVFYPIPASGRCIRLEGNTENFFVPEGTWKDDPVAVNPHSNGRL